jgi:hypothetical protein
LAGVIQRGDVLLAIGHLSLVNLPIDQLMQGLNPLSAPETTTTATGSSPYYKRILELRFEAGVGHELLKSHEDAQKWAKKPLAERQDDTLNEIFSLFPMVDQLSGAPLFEETSHIEEEVKHIEADTLNEEPESSEENPEDDQHMEKKSKEEASPDELISSILAMQQAMDRERFASEFFNWRDDLSELLRKAVRMVESEEEHGAEMTQSERVELGTKVMKLAKALAFGMEDIDKGKDMRSFKTWSTNFSLRSGASARRRHIMDSASLRSHRHHEVETDMDASVGSDDSGSMDDVDGDALLLGLAAHDGIWRKQVIEALEKSIEEMDNGANENEEEQEEEPAPAIDTALTQELGTFLFGKNLNRIITKKKKSFALPPEEITTVLFDLTTNMATTAPDEITVFGATSNNLTYQSSYGTLGKAKAALRADILLANRFILYEALPVWLKSFRALGLDQRRVFWPIMRHSSDSYTGSNLGSDADSLTVESFGSTPRSPNITKNLRESIEDQELDIETRAET